MNTQIITKEIYKVDEHGETVLVETTELTIEVPTEAELVEELTDKERIEMLEAKIELLLKNLN